MDIVQTRSDAEAAIVGEIKMTILVGGIIVGELKFNGDDHQQIKQTRDFCAPRATP